MTQSPLDAHWADLVSAAVVGTDRRDPPDAPVGVVADLAADDPRHSPAGRLLQQAAAATVARRAGRRPPALDTLAAGDAARALDAVTCGSPVGTRPLTPPSASRTWRRLVAEWPILEDEWLLAVAAAGRCLAPDLLVAALRRHRSDPVRHARVRLAGGPLAEWLVARSPHLAPVKHRRVDDIVVTSLSDLSVTSDVEGLLAVAPHEPLAPSGAPLLGLAEQVMITPLADGRFGPAHRQVLVNLLARVHPGLLVHLDPLLVAVADDPAASAHGRLIALSLVDLVRCRATMLTELEPTT